MSSIAVPSTPILVATLEAGPPGEEPFTLVDGVTNGKIACELVGCFATVLETAGTVLCQLGGNEDGSSKYTIKLVGDHRDRIDELERMFLASRPTQL